MKTIILQIFLFLLFLTATQAQNTWGNDGTTNTWLESNTSFRWNFYTLNNERETFVFGQGNSLNHALLFHGDNGTMEKVAPLDAGPAFLVRNTITEETSVFKIFANGQVHNNNGLRIQVGENERPFEIYSPEKEENVFQVMKNGQIFSTEIEVKYLSFPDYVFSEDYYLMPLSKLADYINEHRHLPNIPSAEEVSTSGIGVGELQVKQLEKIEELTLYLLQMKEALDELKADNENLKKRVFELEKEEN
jgi:hypothetical protein